MLLVLLLIHCVVCAMVRYYPLLLCRWWSSFAIGKKGILFGYACKIHLTFAYACKKIEENFESFVIIVVNACILGCNVGFGLLFYHTFIWFFFSISNLKLKMVQFSENENTCEVFMNDVMEKKK